MGKNDNPNATRLYDSMTRHGKKEAADRFSEEYPLAAAADFGEQFDWAKNVCAFLEENCTDEEIKAIRMDCVCGPDPRNVASIKGVYQKENDPHAFVEKMNKLNLGFSLEYDGESYYLIYPQCYCSCVENGGQLSKTWCYCTLGYSKRMFEGIFDRKVQVELINSVKLGDANCRIRIIPA